MGPPQRSKRPHASSISDRGRTKPKDGTFLYGDDPSVPAALKLLKPSSIRINDENIDLEFGGALLHFGIRAFRPGLAGSGTKQLGEGLWFYSENGRFPSKP